MVLVAGLISFFIFLGEVFLFFIFGRMDFDFGGGVRAPAERASDCP
jgi:hypothetical protein